MPQPPLQTLADTAPRSASAPDDHLLGIYNRAPIAVAHGEGIWLTDTMDETWLDCVCGIATNALGHAHPVLVAAKVMPFAAHGSTFGGNPLAMAVANAAFDILSDEQSLAHARALSKMLFERLGALARAYPDLVLDVRGKGLLISLKLTCENRTFMALAREERLLVAGGGDNCVRLLPPLTMSFAEAEEAVRRLAATLHSARRAANRKAAA